MSPTQRMQALLRDLEALAERAREHERVMAAGVRAATAWDPDDRDWVVRAAVDARIAREDAHARLIEGRALLNRAHRTACATRGLAAMEDDTVLCAQCAHELDDEHAAAMGATTIHAWLQSSSQLRCQCCGEPDPIGVAGEGGVSDAL